MSAMSLRLQRNVEHKLSRMGLDLRNLDVLVINGDVVLTGKFICRESNEPLSELGIHRIKNLLYRIAGINSVKCVVVDHPVFV